MDNYLEFRSLINNCNQGDPLLSSTSLGRRLDEIPLENLDRGELRILTQPLNKEQLIPTKDGLARDYRGLGELMGYNTADIETRFSRSVDPVIHLIDQWVLKRRLASQSSICNTSINDLIKLIEQIERFDVIDDAMGKVIEIASQDFRKNNQVATPSRTAITMDLSSNVSHLDLNDAFDGSMRYDAYVCYAPEDSLRAQQLIQTLEDYGKRIATADMLPPGYFENDALMKLIDQHCRKFISIVTPNFLRSRECNFQVTFAHELGVVDTTPKILPILLERCETREMPRLIQLLSKIDMTSGDIRSANDWRLRKLLNALSYNGH